MAIQWHENITLDKDPNAVLDYALDWSSWLGTDTISALTVTVDTGITLESSTFDDTTTTAFISGGTVGTTYNVTYSITGTETSPARQEDRTIRLRIKNK